MSAMFLIGTVNPDDMIGLCRVKAGKSGWQLGRNKTSQGLLWAPGKEDPGRAAHDLASDFATPVPVLQVLFGDESLV